MGGKQKQAQRTKNNARPSNSGRSAELLAHFNPNLNVRMLESGFSGVGFSLSSFTDNVDTAMDVNYQLVIKKMGKKDAITKIKGLQEFATLVKESEQETVKTVLSTWARYYCTLALDVDHKVREAAHLAHTEVVIKTKKLLAPHLKSIIGPWFISQFDNYAPAASAATQSFNDAFPAKKHQEVIVYCQEEILTYLNKNISVKLAKQSNDDALKMKCERLVIASLQAYTIYLKIAPLDAVLKCEQLNRELINNEVFWLHANSDVVQIRAGFYKVIAALCQKCVTLVKEIDVKVMMVIFGNMNKENDPIVQGCLWEALLLIISTVPEWWKCVNVEEIFLPKLWDALNDAGHGNATIIYPSFLPLLSHLPESIDVEEFYNNFFNSMRHGLTKKSGKLSIIEHRIIHATYIECMQYAVVRNHQADNSKLCTALIQNHFLPFIDWLLLDDQPSHKTSFNKIALLIQSWYKNQRDYFNLFIDELVQLFVLQTSKTSSLAELVERQHELLVNLKHVPSKTNNKSVKFKVMDDADDEQADDSKVVAKEVVTIHKPHSLGDDYAGKMQDFACKLVKHYITLINSSKLRAIFDVIYSIMQEFNSKIIFDHISTEYGGYLYGIFRNLIKNWINDDALHSKNVFDITFLLLQHLGDGCNDEKTKILDYFDKMNNSTALCWCITRALSYPHNFDAAIKKWLLSANVTKFIVNIARCEVDDTSSTELTLLLKQAFAQSENNAFYVNDNCILEVIEILSECLKSPDKHEVTIDTCSSLSSYIASIIYTENLVLKYREELLVALFSLSSNIDKDCEFITNDTLWEVNTAWIDSLQTIIGADEVDNAQLTQLIERFYNILETSFQQHRKVHLTGEKITDLFALLAKSKPFLFEQFVVTLLQRQSINSMKASFVNISKSIAYFHGGLYFSSADGFGLDTINLRDEDVSLYFQWKNLIMTVIYKDMLNVNKAVKLRDDYDEDCDDNEDEIILYKLIDQAEFLYDILEDLMMAGIIMENFKNLSGVASLHLEYAKLETNMTEILKQLTADDLKQLEEKIQTNFATSQLSPKIAYQYYNKYKQADIKTTYEKLSESIADLGTNEKLSLLINFAGDIDYDYIEHGDITDDTVSIITLRTLTHCREIDVQIASVFNKIKRIHGEYEGAFYDINANNWEKNQVLIEVMRLWTKLLCDRTFTSMQKWYWDLIALSLASWTSKLPDIKHKLNNLQMAALINSLAQLYIAIQDYIRWLTIEEPQSPLIGEWRNVFLDDLTKEFAKLWLHLAETYQQRESKCLTLQEQLFIQNFGKITSELSLSTISTMKWMKWFKVAGLLMFNAMPCLQLYGYQMMVALLPGLIQVDTKSLGDYTPHKKGFLFEQFKEVLGSVHQIVHTMLAEFKLGEENCRVKPFTDSYTYTFGYLLTWNILLKQLKEASNELKFQYTDWLRNEDLLNNLLGVVFKLMPEDVVQHPESRMKRLESWFSEEPSLAIDSAITCEAIERLVCWIFASTLFQLPASVRQWWTSSDSKISQIVDKITSSYVSPHLCAHELDNVIKHEEKFKNLTVKIHQSVREVIAIYTVDEAQMELTIKLPVNYPLCGPDVECNRQIGGTSHKQWLMQLKMCLLHQNGHIWDGLALWNNNLDKKFEGVEECYICFAVLHPGTYQLPKLSCKTCKKKFHAACLYKWFSTSNKSTCPICRNLF